LQHLLFDGSNIPQPDAPFNGNGMNCRIWAAKSAFLKTKGSGKSDDGRAARKRFAAAEPKALHRSGAQLRSD